MDFFNRRPTRDPERIRLLLGLLCDELQEAVGAELESVILYGSLVSNGSLESERDRVHLMFVVRHPSSKTLDKMSGPIRKAEREIALTTMILTQEDLQTSSDVFPIKFHAMQMHHRLLFGVDVLSHLTISDDHLRLRCEQQLKNLMLRMRTLYVHRCDDQVALAAALIEANRDWLLDAQACLSLNSGVVPIDDMDVADQFGVRFGLDCQVVKDIKHLTVHSGTSDHSNPKLLFNRFMSLTRDSALAIDGVEVAQ